MLFQEVVVPYVGFIDFKGIFLKEGSVPDEQVPRFFYHDYDDEGSSDSVQRLDNLLK